jgi:prophage antirepressor-like protein
METNIQIFKSPQFGEIRTAGTSEKPLFCLADLCKPLGLSPKGVNQRLSDGVISNYPLSTNGGIQNLLFITEDGLYDVILDSRKPEAKQFRKWITSEVLPDIRKTGGYMSAKSDETPEEIMARALIVAQSTIERVKQQNQMLSGENELLQQENKILAPKAEYTDKVLQSTSTYTMTQVAKEMGMSAISLERKLHERKIMFNQSGQWLLYEKYQNKGYTKYRTYSYTRSDGKIDSNTITVWTESGRAFLHHIFRQDLQIV